MTKPHSPLNLTQHDAGVLIEAMCHLISAAVDDLAPEHDVQAMRLLRARVQGFYDSFELGL